MKKIIKIIAILLIITGCQKQENNNETKKEFTSEKFKIVDTTETCAEALEKIYETEKYTYSLPCIKSNNIKIIFKDGSEYTLKEVLENNILTIDELIETGLKVYKEEKVNDNN